MGEVKTAHYIVTLEGEFGEIHNTRNADQGKWYMYVRTFTISYLYDRKAGMWRVEHNTCSGKKLGKVPAPDVVTFGFGDSAKQAWMVALEFEHYPRWKP